MTTQNSPVLSNFRKIAFAEGVSFLVLLFIAMPLKYLANWPHAVKYTGWLHGVLFVIFIISLIKVWEKHRWGAGRVFGALAASLLPFGTFVLEAKLKKEYGAV
ncbi:MAG: DUF3817 domain-containing protein [Ferruginibacter sp.]